VRVGYSGGAPLYVEHQEKFAVNIESPEIGTEVFEAGAVAAANLKRETLDQAERLWELLLVVLQ